MKIFLVISIMVLSGLMFLPDSPVRLPYEIASGTETVDLADTTVQPLTIPLYFIPNQGQVHKCARFYARTSRYTLWLTTEGLVFDSTRAVSEAETSKSLERDVSRLLFVGSNPHPALLPVDVSRHQVNYFTGQDPTKWLTGLKTSKAVLYKDLYKQIDLKVYGMEKQIEYDWMVFPGGNPDHIRFRYEEVKGSRLNDSGDLVITTAWGEITHKRPVGYQVFPGTEGAKNSEKKVKVEVSFKKTGADTYGFEVGEYDRSRVLIIDPVVLVYSTYLGGSSDELGVGLAVDNIGCAYLTAETYSTDFPVKGAYQSTFTGGSTDVYITKFAASGSSLIYSTFLGGSGNEEAEGIQVDSSGRAYVTGITSSTNFPGKNAFQNTYGGGDSDAFVTILSASGSSLVYSTYLGGSGKDQAYAIALDSSKNIYVTGGTDSTNFPIQNAYEASFGGGNADTFVTKINASGSSLGYSTYLGGSGRDTAFGIAVNGSNAYITGYTASANFPLKNEYQGTHAGGAYDGFVTKLATTGNSLVYSTFLGGSGADYPWGIAVDSTGCAYVTGETASTNFPTKNAYQYSHAGGEKDIFVSQFSMIGTTLEYSTYLGGLEADAAAHIALNSSNDIFITGYTSSSNFPIKRAYQSLYNGDLDVFVTMIPASTKYLLGFSTYLGGGDLDTARSIALDGSGNVYVAGYTESPDFPTEGAYQDTAKGGKDAFVAKLSTYEFGTLCGAVDNCNLTWTTGGSANWTETLLNSYYDGDAAMSGSNSGNVSSFIQTTITGPGQLSFWWKKSTYCNNKYKFYIDSQALAENTSSSWQQKTFDITSGSHTLKWLYEEPSSCGHGYLDNVAYTPESSIVLDRTALTFGAVPGTYTGAQTFSVANPTTGTLNWTATVSNTWLSCSPTSGSGNAVVSVSVNPTGLSAGFYNGTITLTAPGATNSPQTVSVTLHVYTTGQSSLPFGSYETPTDNATIRSSVPFTGWVLDDLGVESVKIYLQSGSSMIYIGDSIFVEGARPDVEQSFPGYPYNYKAGWGYMMLTNFLPNGGNGTFNIAAIATDMEGHQVFLGTKTLTVDNASAVKPFGAIDTPAQGGTASGSAYKNWGWVLTPTPNTIPIDGTTLNVWVDGVSIGNPTYNIYRSDVASLFPGYSNSNGAAGYLVFDTTAYANGIHTILWTAVDNAGNADGIGSRYFMTWNSSPRLTSGLASLFDSSVPQHNSSPLFKGDLLIDTASPIRMTTGYEKDLDPSQLKVLYPNKKGNITIDVKELERVELHFGDGDTNLSGWLNVGEQFRPLPIGSYLDQAKGIFYWQTGLAFVGEYHLVFVREDGYGNCLGRNVVIKIKSKF